ncbi:phosphoglycerate dehydrogenase [Marinisporobacter balticus]|uniref:D-3-phosphoglycerate dehydrogenase n=1 Tax=Marinisporobacter balticus TaxID=2018667 RepID=A0A4R2KX20_9FIRM|nr:phosphoglycerate dehydrogenase [Marinisporobacter balticus]TCO77417.1 D-3-phosphoglycerate dehydrogenase [Marinisporobacter balticus]
MSKKVAITSEFFGRFSDEGERILKEAGFEVISNQDKKFLEEDALITIIANADAIICDLEKINKKVMDHAPNLKIIARRGVGVDSVDVKYAKEKGINVARTLGVVEKPVAELVMAYILQIHRKIHESNQEMKKGNWNKQLGNSLEGKILGIVGMGNIAKEVVRKAKAFDMKIIYTNYTRKPKLDDALQIEYVSFEELLKHSDVISIHVPLTETTANMFDYHAMKFMKKQPILINTARGPVVNEEDLCKALEEKRISFAAIDVFDVEPKMDSPLRKYDNVVLTPHVGTFTKEVFINMDILAAKNVIDYLG